MSGRIIGGPGGYVAAAVAGVAFAGYSGQYDLPWFPPNPYLAVLTAAAAVDLTVISWANADPLARWTPGLIKFATVLDIIGGLMTVYLGASLHGDVPAGFPSPAWGGRHDNLGVAFLAAGAWLTVKGLIGRRQMAAG